MTRTEGAPSAALLLLCAVVLALAGGIGRAADDGSDPASTTIAMVGAGDMGSALGWLRTAAGYHVIFSSRHPEELDPVVDAAGFDMPWTTNDESVRPIAEALIRATGGTPVYEGGLANAREYR